MAHILRLSLFAATLAAIASVATAAEQAAVVAESTASSASVATTSVAAVHRQTRAKAAATAVDKKLQHALLHALPRGHASHPLRRVFRGLNACTDSCIPQCQQQCTAAGAGCEGQCPQACADACAGQSGGGDGGSGGVDDRCASAGSSAEARAIEQQCGSQDVDFSALFMISNNTAAAKVEIERTCAAGCTGALRTAIRAYRDCFDAASMRLYNAFFSMCDRVDGETCAWRIRGIAELEVCDASSMQTQAACSANTNCSWNAADRTCDSAPTPALLQKTCTPCYDRYIMLMSEVLTLGAAQYDGPSASSTREQIRFMQRTLVNEKNFYCGRVNGTWCNPLVSSIDERVIDYSPSNNMTLAAVQSTVGRVCTRTGQRCIRKTVGALVNVVADVAEVGYSRCMRSYYAAYYGPSYCRSYITSPFGVVNALTARMNLLCSTNAASENCGVAVHGFVRDGCYASISRGTCNATCASWFTTTAQSMGCCWDHVRRMTHQLSYPAPINMPTDVQQYYDRRRPNASVLASDFAYNPMNSEVRVCNRTTGNSFDAAATVTAVTSTCPEATPVARELRLTGMRWDRVQSDAALRAQLEAALRADVARSLGVDEADIVNGSLVPDDTQQLTASSSSSSSSRRQAATTAPSTVGTKYAFAVGGTSAADAEANAAAFDTAVQTNAITATETADVVAESCTDCVGSPTAAPGETAAPPPTGALFASLVGADTSGTLPPDTSSTSAAAGPQSAVVASAVAAAVASLVVALAL